MVVYKKLTGCFLLCLLLAACATRTEFGRKRPAGGIVAKNVDAHIFTSIDTAKVYEIFSAEELPALKPLTSFNKTFLKFYPNGRVGTFYQFRAENANDLDPRKAEVGYFFEEGMQLFMRSYFEHPQGDGWVKELITFDQDTLILSSGHIKSKYRPLKVTVEALKYRPDW